MSRTLSSPNARSKHAGNHLPAMTVLKSSVISWNYFRDLGLQSISSSL